MPRKIGLAVKLIVAILLGTTLIFGGAALYNHYCTKKIILRQVEANARNLTMATVFRIEAVQRAVAQIPRNLADVVEAQPRERNELVRLLREAVRHNPEIFGAAIAFEPYAFDPATLYFAPYGFRDGDQVKTTWLGDDDYRYFFLDWYQIPRELGQPLWSEPYFDEGGGDIVMSTFSVPFFRDPEERKELLGVITADVSLAWLRDLVASVRVLKSGYAFLVSANGVLVTHPDSRLVMRESLFSLAETRQDDELRRIGQAMLKGEKGFEPCIDFASGRPAWLAYAPLPLSGWSLGVVFPGRELFADLRRLTFTVSLVGLGGFVLLCLVIGFIARRVTRPLAFLARATREIARGDLDTDLPLVPANDEVGDLARSFGDMRSALKEYIADLATTTAAKERMESELMIARTIQMSFLPKRFPPFPEKESFDIFARLEPARQVGGDLYDFSLLDDCHLLFLVGDVSDKGVPAALFMAVTKTLLKGMAVPELSPAELLNRLNRELCMDNDSAMFVTLFCGILDLESGEVAFANGGHNPPLLLRRDGTAAWLEMPPGLVLGAMEDAGYAPGAVRLAAGDQLLLYTDGVTEAMNEVGELYSDPRLLEVARQKGREAPQPLVEHILASVEAFAGQAPQADDITLLAVRYRGGTENR